MSDIICVTHRGLCKTDFLTRLEEIAAGGVSAVILREKDLSEEEYKALAAQALEICARYGVRCILHSFVRAAAELGAQAIHLPMHVLRRMACEEKMNFHVVGASCHSAQEAREAQELGCTYITAGHVFDTACKSGTPGRGTDFLEGVCRAVSIPVYAIGGISTRNIRAVRAAGARGACVMSALMQCDDVAALLADFDKGR